MCQECNVLMRKVQELDEVMRHTIGTVNKQNEKIKALETNSTFLVQVAEKQNEYIDRVINVLEKVQGEVTHVHEKVCADNNGVVKLPIQNRLLH